MEPALIMPEILIHNMTMNISEIKVKIYNQFDVEALGFKVVDGKLNAGDFILLRERNEITGKIFFSIDYRNDLSVNWGYSFYYSIFVPRVNAILVDLFPKNEIGDVEGVDELENTLFMPPHDFQLIRQLLDAPASIQNFIEEGKYYEDRFVQTCRIRKEIIERFALPFFDRNTTLKFINDEIIDKTPLEKMNEIIPGETVFKIIIIMRLCGNNRYDEFVTKYKNRIVNAIQSGATKYESYYQKLEKLLEYLNKIS